jgi:glucuronate isomerase
VSCPFAPAGEEELDTILQNVLAGRAFLPIQVEKYQTALLVYLGGRYRELGWVMQLHVGCERNLNSRMFNAIGPDTGFDAMNGDSKPQNLAKLLGRLDRDDKLPRTVLYSLIPAESEVIATIAGCFMAEADCPGKLQLGAPWWFNDTKSGMEKQLLDYANSTLLGNFIGMLTDSRSFLSYTRHEYFRRILCSFLGKLVDEGEVFADYDALGKIVQDISYNNALRFFGFQGFMKR